VRNVSRFSLSVIRLGDPTSNRWSRVFFNSTQVYSYDTPGACIKYPASPVWCGVAQSNDAQGEARYVSHPAEVLDLGNW
jgi:hypothetical protein